MIIFYIKIKLLNIIIKRIFFSSYNRSNIRWRFKSPSDIDVIFYKKKQEGNIIIILTYCTKI